MKPSPRNKSKSNRESDPRRRHGSHSLKHVPAPTRLWPALVALNGFGLAVNQAAALELGEMTVQSALGQPLRASIAYALGQNETLESHCLFLRPPAQASGFPVIRNATATASNGMIRVTGSTPIREPILSLRLTVDCPGTAHLSRDYTVFVDPATVAQAAAEESRAAPVAARRPEATTTAAPTAAAAAPVRRPVRTASADAAPIRSQSTYRVQPGDTLSGIAARIQDRDIGLWDAVEVIFAANPEAFIGSDRNLIKAGSLLVLPAMGPVLANTPERSADTRSTPTVSDATPPVTIDGAGSEPAAASRVREAADAATATSGTEAATAPRPAGDAAAATDDNPFVSPVAPPSAAVAPATAGDASFGPARTVIPETEIETSGGRQLTPRVSVAPSETGDGLGSLAWLGGTGIAIILGLLLFGRQLKDRFGSPGDILPAGLARGRRRTDATADAEPTTTLDDNDATDTFESPLRAQPVALDADLGTGSGFDDDGEIDVAQDFGFSTSRDLYEDVDLELPAEPVRAGPDDISPAAFKGRRATDTVIVEKEIPPSDDTGEYDLSMIVDATRQSIDESEDTTKDLRAIEVDTGDNEALDSSSLTLSRQIDYRILEQDYEDELTATQALNAKLDREAALAVEAGALEETRQLNTSESSAAEYATVDDDLTRELPGSEDDTVEMPLDQDPTVEAPVSLEDSGVNAEVTTTVSTADNDETIDIESATIDTKKLRAS